MGLYPATQRAFRPTTNGPLVPASHQNGPCGPHSKMGLVVPASNGPFGPPGFWPTAPLYQTVRLPNLPTASTWPPGLPSIPHVQHYAPPRTSIPHREQYPHPHPCTALSETPNGLFAPVIFKPRVPVVSVFRAPRNRNRGRFSPSAAPHAHSTLPPHCPPLFSRVSPGCTAAVPHPCCPHQRTEHAHQPTPLPTCRLCTVSLSLTVPSPHHPSTLPSLCSPRLVARG